MWEVENIFKQSVLICLILKGGEEMKIEEYIYESFILLENAEEYERNLNHEFCKKADMFIRSLDKQKQKDFSDLDKLMYLMHVEEEMRLINFILFILRRFFSK